MAGVLEVHGRRVRLSSLDRVLWPAVGFTKGDLVDYYRRVGEAMVPHLAGRPLMLARFPEGIEGRGWGQWECRGRPAWMRTAPLRLRAGKVVETCRVDDVAGLLWVANQGTIEIHPYLARASTIEQPTTVVFDLDPGPPAGLLECAAVALDLRVLLEGRGLASFPKATGGSGLHVFVPLNTPVGYDETKPFARAVAAELRAARPDRVVDRMAKAERAGRVFVDWAQNDQRKQTVAVYSLRATPVPAVAAPLAWEELERACARRDPGLLTHGPGAVVGRLQRQGDLFSPVATLAQELPA